MPAQFMQDGSAAAPKPPAAPVVMFVHARPEHTRRTLDALAANTRALETPLFVFADAARNAKEAEAVRAVRELVANAHGFAALEIVERETNFGLARNIVDGVGSIIRRYGRAIVLEDDLVTGPHFLEFLNDALEKYAEDPRVWHINGWTYPTDLGVGNRPFFTGVMECWGWATWADRWAHFRKDPDALLKSFTPSQVQRFNVGGGYDYWEDVKRNAVGTMKTWAVFWYATIFRNEGLCLSPPQSHVVNIGIDGSGVNSGSADIYSATVVADSWSKEWPAEVRADDQAFESIRNFLLSKRASRWRRLASRCKWFIRRLTHRLSQP